MALQGRRLPHGPDGEGTPIELCSLGVEVILARTSHVIAQQSNLRENVQRSPAGACRAGSTEARQLVCYEIYCKSGCHELPRGLSDLEKGYLQISRFSEHTLRSNMIPALDVMVGSQLSEAGKSNAPDEHG